LSTIDIELKRRADLIPNLVKIVKEYREFEREVQQILAETRTGVAFSSEKTNDLNKVSSIIMSLEKYPDLKASKQFLNLMTELRDTEERIAQMREFYNKTVLEYNNLISQAHVIPLAILMKKKRKEYLNFS
jgi:LemA protein